MSAPMSFTVYVEGPAMGQRVRDRLLELCADSDVAAEVDVIDITVDPAAAEAGNVVGIPTVVRERPRPRRRVIGALDDSRRVAEALGLDDRPDDDTQTWPGDGRVEPESAGGAR